MVEHMWYSNAVFFKRRSCINGRFNNLHADFSAKFTYVQNKFDDASNKCTTQLQHMLQQIGTSDVTGIDETNSAGGDIENSSEPFHYSLFKGHTSYQTIYH
jgi:GTP1/Obg family GTP-binding protein